MVLPRLTLSLLVLLPGSPLFAASPEPSPEETIDRAMAEAGLTVRPPSTRTPPDPSPEGAADPSALSEEITVSITTVVVRAVDNLGEPIRGLEAGDFRARVGGAPVPVLAADWISSDAAGTPAPLSDETAATPLSGELPVWRAPEIPRGQLHVFFVQANLEATRAKGQLRLLPLTRELMDSWKPDDRAAVVSHDSHFKLWLDFSHDREAIYRAISRAIRAGGEPGAVRPNRTGPSLARHFDETAANGAASPERALHLLGEALKPLPGDKAIVYLGWGLGRYGAGGITMGPHYRPALDALSAARAAVFVLDITSDDHHTLEVGLQNVARSTGGTYQKTHVFPTQAIHRLARTLSGHYLLTLDRTALPAGGGRITIELPGEKNATILVAPYVGG